jgi:hypothetical protein
LDELVQPAEHDHVWHGTASEAYRLQA